MRRSLVACLVITCCMAATTVTRTLAGSSNEYRTICVDFPAESFQESYCKTSQR